MSLKRTPVTSVPVEGRGAFRFGEVIGPTTVAGTVRPVLIRTSRGTTRRFATASFRVGLPAAIAQANGSAYPVFVMPIVC